MIKIKCTQVGVEKITTTMLMQSHIDGGWVHFPLSKTPTEVHITTGFIKFRSTHEIGVHFDFSTIVGEIKIFWMGSWRRLLTNVLAPETPVYWRDLEKYLSE